MSFRRSLIVTSAARDIKLSAQPIRIAASVFMLQGTTIIPSVANEPLEIGAPWSRASCTCDARSERSFTLIPISCNSVARAHRDTTK
jgi:hypothetical protein